VNEVVSIWSKAYEHKVDLKQDIQYILVVHKNKYDLRKQYIKQYMKLLSK
jgi:hypothetical protein